MLSLRAFQSRNFWITLGRSALVGLSGLAIAKAFEVFSDAEHVNRAAAFQCARLNDVTQFSPTQLATLAWRSMQAAGPQSFAEQVGYAWDGDACIRTKEQQVVVHLCRIEGRKAVDRAIAEDDAKRRANPPKAINCEFKDDPGGLLKRACRADQLANPLRDVPLRDISAVTTMIAKSTEENCLRSLPDPVGHWAHDLRTAVPHGLIMLAQPVVAIADVLWHGLFQLSWTTVINWLCLAAGGYFIVNRLNRYDFGAIAIVIYPVAIVAGATIVAFVVQYLMLGALVIFSGLLKLSAMALGASFAVQFFYELARRTGEHIASEQAKAMIDPPKS